MTANCQLSTDDSRKAVPARASAPRLSSRQTGEVLVRVENVSKKFCRSLKKSLWYGVKDIAHELNPFGRPTSIARRRLLPGGTYEAPTATHSPALRDEEFWAVNDVSFELRRGECLGLIGHNGAGKTTLLKMLNGLIKPDAGRIEMRGRIGALIALGAGFNPILTGRENIYVNASVLGLSNREVDEKLDEIISFAEIGKFIDSPVQSYSSGMTVRLGFAIASSLEPDVLILDEVLAVGDAGFRTKCFNRVNQLLQNAAVIFVSHNMPQVSRVSNRLMLMDSGKQWRDSVSMPETIARYYSKIKATGQQAASGNHIGSVEVISNCEDKACYVDHGAPLLIEAQLTHLTELKGESLRVLITFSDQEGGNVAQVAAPIADVPNHDSVRVRVSIPANPFNAGTYTVHFSLVSGDTRFIHSAIRNACSFVVRYQVTAYAPVIIRDAEVLTIPKR